ncbi:unnamed protein product [Lactuca saligna]|uniref:Uncharacterized protein n=1 Tax=Lactuca saligna TaxID=75948 RepID=A0AA35Y914_LACSI|nr:unnamed protein product [Lactuca saligna]
MNQTSPTTIASITICVFFQTPPLQHRTTTPALSHHHTAFAKAENNHYTPQVFQQTLKSRNQLSLYRFKSLGCRGYYRSFLFYYQLSQLSLLVLVVRRRGLPVAVTGGNVVFRSRKSTASSQFTFTAISSDQFSLRNIAHHHGPSHRCSPPPIVSTSQLTSIILNYDALKKKNASKSHHPRGQRVSFPDLLIDLLYIPRSLPSGKLFMSIIPPVVPVLLAPTTFISATPFGSKKFRERRANTTLIRQV